MAEEEGDAGVGLVFWVIGGVIILTVLWFASGAYKTADVGGLFIKPLPPVNTGESYGPQVGQPNPDYQTNEQQQ